MIYGLAILLGVIMPIAAATSSPGSEQWYRDGEKTVQAARHLKANRRRARNLILFIGDGMGVSTVTAARILEGQQRGQPGEENLLSFEHFPYVALSKTYNSNQQTPDSAGTMSAIMTGAKTRAGLVSMDQTTPLNECSSASGHKLQTLLEQAELAHKSTGIVTTARLTHATPAATYAHSPGRKWEGDSKMPAQARADGCKDIAVQLIEFPYGDGPEVALGGGRQYFMPEQKGKRKDGRNLIDEWLATRNNAAYVWNGPQLEALDLAHTGHLLGLFNTSHMQYEADRSRDTGGEPSLTEMTRKAIEVLQKNKHGYFLMVEAARIDHAHHAGSAYRALTDTIELSNAVAAARTMTSTDDTLIIVTADHSHVFTIAGDPTRGNPILGKVVNNDNSGKPETKADLAADGKPYTTLGYQNGPGYVFDKSMIQTSKRRKPDAGRTQDLSDIDTTDRRFHQQSLVPLKSETHSGEDVAVYADGPGAYLLHGVIEQNVIYHIMRQAMGL
ncbi:MAG: alkaline phosphatase [Gammaproteobacteria bacterium]|nr:MAG: alkaline phosphatase [Gammaproteobacteria bacterium]